VFAVPAVGAVVSLTEHANGKTVHARVGDTIALRLPANATTGYFWTFTPTGGRVLHVVSSR
jgi:predicted secreted protein